MEKISFMSACKEFFGVREDQTLPQFGQEVKALTPDDRKEMAPGLSKMLGKEVTI